MARPPDVDAADADGDLSSADLQVCQHTMNISEIFIRRPIATSLLMAAIAMFGVVAYRALPVSDLPTVDSPTIQVQAGLPGRDPASMAAAVASPIERQLTTSPA